MNPTPNWRRKESTLCLLHSLSTYGLFWSRIADKTNHTWEVIIPMSLIIMRTNRIRLVMIIQIVGQLWFVDFSCRWFANCKFPIGKQTTPRESWMTCETEGGNAAGKNERQLLLFSRSPYTSLAEHLLGFTLARLFARFVLPCLGEHNIQWSSTEDIDAGTNKLYHPRSGRPLSNSGRLGGIFEAPLYFTRGARKYVDDGKLQIFAIGVVFLMIAR